MSPSHDLFKQSLLALARQYYGVPYDAKKLPMPEELSNVYHEFLSASKGLSELDKDFARSLETIRLLYGRQFYTLNIDGGVRLPTPSKDGAAAAAFVLFENEQPIHKNAFPIPSYYQEDGSYHESEGTPITSHMAEYEALNTCLRTLIHTNVSVNRIRLQVRTDSQVLHSQLKGKSRNRTPHLSRLMHESRYLMSQFEHVDILHVPREENELANELVQRCLESR